MSDVERAGAADDGPDFGAVGVVVGHATDADGATGLTVVRAADGRGPLRGGVAVFGRATGTRELHALAPEHVSGRVDAVVLSGGSAFGLDAVSGVMRWLEERGHGFPVPGGVVPIVPAAVIFDLAPLGRFGARPTPRMAYEACDRAASRDVAEGSAGAGTGATVGKIAGAAGAMKGGVGCAVESAFGAHVGAVAVVNALGDVRDARGEILAGARDGRGGWVDAAALLAGASDAPVAPPDEFGAGTRAAVADGARTATTAPGLADVSDMPEATNTTLAVVAVSVPLEPVALTQLARAAGAALYRRITPAGTRFDGDIVFALAPERPGAPAAAPPSSLQLEALAVRALERAVERAVRLARGRDGIPGVADLAGTTRASSPR